jgi:thiol-disulfide isomerase/thioredoxin
LIKSVSKVARHVPGSELKRKFVLQVAAAEERLPEPVNGIYNIDSSESFDDILKLFADKVVVLLAGLSWCRPCKSLTRPFEKLASHYQDGAVFVKVLGDSNDNTKRLFKNKLQEWFPAFRCQRFHLGHLHSVCQWD